MPITVPTLDDRRYPDLVADALTRISVHTPEWTNYQQSDPGITLVEVFAFLTESLLYRANQIPERNRLKFLQLLGIPLREASAAQGLVTFSRPKGSASTVTLASGIEVRAGQTTFRTTRGVDVLPIEAQVYYKRNLGTPSPEVLAYYQQLYASFDEVTPSATPTLYEAVPFAGNGGTTLDLSDASDGSFWIALLTRSDDKPASTFLPVIRQQIANRVLTIALTPVLRESQRELLPKGQVGVGQPAPKWRCYVPSIPASGGLPEDVLQRIPQYRQLNVSAISNVFEMPGLIEVTLPDASGLTLWNNLEPLEAGVGDFPPAVDDTNLESRIITWLRFQPSGANIAPELLSVAINGAPVTQRAHVTRERLPEGTGEPDQSVTLAKSPVLPDSVHVFVTSGGKTDEWTLTSDLYAAGPEVLVTDPRQPPGTTNTQTRLNTVFALDSEAGQIQFGDGTHGSRPPAGAEIRVDYDYCSGSAGNLPAGAIASGSSLPTGVLVTNPVATWGGADAETVAQGEKQITRYLQHRERLVTVADFAAIVLRTPGVAIGRLDVLPNFNPALTTNLPGDAAGAVTLLVLPQYDAGQPDAPRADAVFVDSICRYLDDRRLVTTELFVRGATYRQIWISIGMEAAASAGNSANVREAVKEAVRSFVAPLPATPPEVPSPVPLLYGTNTDVVPQPGWPLRKTLVDLEVATVVARVSGVEVVKGVLLARETETATTQIPFSGLELPWLVGISVVEGDPTPIDQIRGAPLPDATGQGLSATVAQFPVIPEGCS